MFIIGIFIVAVVAVVLVYLVSNRSGCCCADNVSPRSDSSGPAAGETSASEGEKPQSPAPPPAQ